MATADTTTADSISGLGETLQNLISINVTGFAKIESSLRREFSGQNKLLGGYLGKNLQLIAEALTGSNDDMIKQMQAEARLAAEQHRETLAAAGGGDAPAGGVEATDASLEWSPLVILAALTGFLVGFFQGFFGPVGALMKGWGTAIKNFFGKPLKWGWTTFKTMLADSKVAGWYKSVKYWFQAKAWDAKFKWAMFKDMLKNSKVAGWYRAVKGWFGSTIKFGWSPLTNLLKNSKIGGWFTSIKAWFGGKFTRPKMPNLKTLWAESTIGKGVKAIKGLFGGKTKIPGIGAIDDVLLKVKNLFGPKGAFSIFKTIGKAFGRIFFFVQIFMTLFDFYTGFVETEGNLLDKILGGLKAAFVGFFGGFMDLGIMLEDGIKWIVAKIAGFFGFDEEEVAASMESFSIFKPLKKMVTDVADWFVGLFDFSSFSAGLISMAKLIFLPITALLDLTGFVWDWFMELFGWKDENAPKDERTLTTKLGDLLIGVWDWFAGIFTFGQNDGAGIKMGPYAGVLPALVSMVTGIWGWFKGLFDFSSFGAALGTAAKLLFLPYVALIDLIGAVWNWFAELFGFDDKKIPEGRTLTQFFGDMLADVWAWIKDFFSVSKIAKMIPGVGALLGGDSQADKNAKGMEKIGLMSTKKGMLDDDQIVDTIKLQSMMKGMSVAGIKEMFLDMKAINESDAIGKGDEIANWKVVQKTMMEGMKLAALQKEANELSGSGGTTTIIQDNSQNQSNSSQPIVIPAADISPGNGQTQLQQ
jgi:hypothetical protein